jgi:hypothetical protein
MDKTRWMLQWICAGVLACGVLTGCRVDSDEVEYWKGSVKGPTRLVALLGSDKYSNELRTEAALAMVEMDRNDVNGLALLDEALQELQQKDKPASEAIVTAMAPKLEAALAEEVPTEEGAGPPEAQVRAKDAAYMVIPYAPDGLRADLIESLVGWYSKDFAGRSLAGDYSAEQVTRALGAPAARMLVDGMHSQMPRQALIKIAEIVGEGGDPETKAKAAEKLVAMEREMEKKAFLDWLGEEITASMKDSGEPVDAARVRALALYNREAYINEGALPAMKHLADQETVSTRLLQIADTKPAPGDPEAWASRLNERRANALRALEGHVTRTDLNRMLSIALDSSNPIEVRDYAFDRVGDIGSRDAIPQLWPLVQSTGCTAASCSQSDELAKRLRWRAGELLLAAAGPSEITEFSEKLPEAPGIQYEPEELAGYARRMSQMTPPPTQAAAKLMNSPQWWNRVIALRYLERRGTEADIPRMQKMVSDGAVVAGEGWSQLEPPMKTVGDVAKSSIDSLKTREQGD